MYTPDSGFEMKEHLSSWKSKEFYCWMLFLEVSGLDPAFLSIITERQEVLHYDGDGEGHHGNSWDLSWGMWCWLLACIACPL